MGKFIGPSPSALRRQNKATDRHNAAVKRQQMRNAGYTQLARLLPGDMIHHVAPSNVTPPFSFDRDVAIAEAELKRQRKRMKKATLAK